MSFDLLNFLQLKHMSFLHIVQFTEYFLQYLHFSLLQKLHLFSDGKASLIKNLCSFLNSFSFPKIKSISKEKKIFLKKKKKVFLKKKSLKKLVI